MDFKYSCRKGLYREDDPYYVLTVVGRLDVGKPFYFEKTWNVLIADFEFDRASDAYKQLKILLTCHGAENYIRGVIEAHLEVRAWK